MILVVLTVLAVVGYSVFVKVTKVPDYTAEEKSTEQVVITVESGETAISLAEELVKSDVVKSEKAFVNAAKSNSAKMLKQGKFFVHKYLSGEEALAEITDEANLATLKFLIPEGKTVYQTVELISQKTSLTKAQLNSALDDAKAQLPAGVASLEGWIFPASYEFEYDASASDVIKKMIAKTYEVLDRNGVKPEQYEDILKRASIVQEEVNTPADMAKVAQVIDNRLEVDMFLGMDTIVGYGATNGQGNSPLELKQSDLDDATSPYNARKVKGLPPTPISNPGEDAIKAVLHPTPGAWLYFITVDPSTGKTLFLETDGQFEAARADYKSWCAQNPDVCGL